MRKSFVWILGLTALCSAALARADDEARVAAADAFQARWDARAFPFAYSSATTRYSCPALESKIRNILVAVGAHPKTRVRAVACSGARPSRVIRLDITTAVPRPVAEPKASRVVEREKLLARLGIKPELQGEFVARPQRVKLNKAGLGLAAGDCDLLTLLRDQVFPRLGVLVEKGQPLSCSPHQLSSAPPRLSVVALVPSNDAVVQEPPEATQASRSTTPSSP